MQISRTIVNVPKINNNVLVGIWLIVYFKKPCHHFFQTFRPKGVRKGVGVNPP